MRHRFIVTEIESVVRLVYDDAYIPCVSYAGMRWNCWVMLECSDDNPGALYPFLDSLGLWG